MDLELRGRVALVTGASRGIGLAVARTLAAEGCVVGLVARGAKELHRVEEELRATGAVALAVSADVTDRAAVDSAVQRFSRELGQIEILVNNAGGSTAFGRQFDQLSDEDWEQAFRLNVLSAVWVTRAVLPGMREAGQGSIVMVATDAAAQPGGFVPHYTAAKAGILNLAKSLSRKYGPEGIRVNTVSPGMVRTTQLTAFLEQKAKSQGTTVEEAERTLVRESRPDITAGRGSIVMVATDAAAQPGGFVPHYSAAKAGILNLARSLSRKYGHEGIRVNVVSPGMVRTTQLTAFLEQRAKSQGTTVEEAERSLVRESRPDITVGRAADPAEVATVIAFLVSPRASYVNGANWRVDSGEVLSIV